MKLYLILSIITYAFEVISSFTFLPLASPSPSSSINNNNIKSINNIDNSDIHNNNKRCLVKLARTAPTSLFDLENIEAFEDSLDKDDNTDEEDDDDDDDYNDNDGSNNDNELIIEIDELYDNKRLDSVLKSILEQQQQQQSNKDEGDNNNTEKISRSACGKLIKDGNVLLKESQSYKPITQKSFKAVRGMTFKIIRKQSAERNEIMKENISLDVIYEDKYIIVIDKKANMVVHPSIGNWNGTLVNALAYYLSNDSPFKLDHVEEFTNVIPQTQQPQEGDYKMPEQLEEKTNILYYRPGIVHRLDKGTTGVIIIAKTKNVLSTLSKSFANRQVKKTYLAITIGNPGTKVKIDKRIKRHPIHRQKMQVVPDQIFDNYQHQTIQNHAQGNTVASIGRRAISYVDTLGTKNDKLSVVYVRIQTGRTHQIRVHLQNRHTPVYGDDVYGISSWNKKLTKDLLKYNNGHVKSTTARPLLHAHKLEINHPITDERMVFTAPMPNDMSTIAKNIWPDGIIEYPQFFTSTTTSTP